VSFKINGKVNADRDKPIESETAFRLIDYRMIGERNKRNGELVKDSSNANGRSKSVRRSAWVSLLRNSKKTMFD
jgi:hypothetical protein